MPTIREVAKKAGVAAITVSRVINQSGYVSDETRRRVEAAIAELDYVPNVLARGLRSSRTHTLGLLVTDITNAFWTTVARGAEDAAVRHGYSVFLCNTDEDVAKQEQYLRALLSHRVEGLIIAPASSDRGTLAALERARLPFVIVDRRMPGAAADLVLGDSIGGARQLVEHLLARGHRRIAHLGGPAGVSTADDREQGYRQALAEAGIAADPRLVLRGDYKLESGHRLMGQLLELSPLPTAVFAANNVLAVGALVTLREKGLRVPEDVAVVCFDDLPQASLIDPFLTVAAQPAYEFGTAAVELLLARLANPRRPPQTVVLPVELLVRRSS
ncbi:MAG: LacI family DNA-binding transcriptional regulator [Anaerolineae bacterium]|nr:LacI family DNA-binding transcriptional regulator [Anaerolineae bacterium]